MKYQEIALSNSNSAHFLVGGILLLSLLWAQPARACTPPCGECGHWNGHECVPGSGTGCCHCNSSLYYEPNDLKCPDANCYDCNSECECDCDITIDSISGPNYVCVDCNVDYTASVTGSCSCVDWSGGGTPDSNEGMCSFTTHWSTAGEKTVTATPECGDSKQKDVTVVSVDLDMTGIAEDEEDEAGDPCGFVGVNNDDDNDNGTADKDESGTVAGEDDLVEISLSVLPESWDNGKARLRSSCDQCIKVWDSPERGTEEVNEIDLPKIWYFSTDSVPEKLYVEGIHYTSSMKLTLEAKEDGDDYWEGWEYEDYMPYDSVYFLIVQPDIDIYNGKGGSEVDDDDEENVGAYFLVNCDDDDDNNTPDLDDPCVVGEDDLSKISLSYLPNALDVGTLELIKTGPDIKIWTKETKDTEQTDLSWDLASEELPNELWVEGREASDSERDIQLELKYTYNGNSISDKVKATAVEIRLGNAVYREHGFWVQNNRGHGAIVYEYTGTCTPQDLNDSTKFKMIEMDGPTDTKTMATITDDESFPHLDAFGCYTNTSDITYTKRLAIIKIAKALVADAGNIGYTLMNALLCDDEDHREDWDGMLTDIYKLRCDGLIEVCYEKNGIDVWAMKRDYGGISYNYDISDLSDSLSYDAFWGTWSAGSNNAIDNLEEHNDYDDNGWSDTLMPATQCGHTTPVDSDTKFSKQDLCYPIGHKGGN